MKMRHLKTVFKFGYNIINRISLWRYLRYLISVLAIGVLIYSLFSKLPDLEIRNWKHIKTKGVWGRILSIHFNDLKNGWMIIEKSGIFFTNNATNKWQWQWAEKKTSPTHLSAIKLYFLSNNMGWALGKALVQGNRGIYSNYPFILHTINGGKTWDSVIFKQPEFKDSILKDVYFVDALYGWAVGQPGIILKSNNSGETWEIKAKNMNLSDKKPFTSFSSVFFIDRNTGWICGEDGVILYTQDGGNTWTEQYCGEEIDLQKIVFVTKELGLCIGGANIFYTSNGGAKWKLQFNYDTGDTRFCDLAFINLKAGYAITSDGHLFRTPDGGQSWDLESTFIRENTEEQLVKGRTWHSFLNWLFNVFEQRELSQSNWTLSIINKDKLKIWIAGEKEGLFVYPAYEDIKTLDIVRQRIILLIFTITLIVILFWIRYNIKNKLIFPFISDENRLGFAWSCVGLSIFPLIIVFLLSIISYYLHLYAANTFIYRLLINYMNPLLSILATVCISVSFLAAILSLILTKKDEQLNQQLNLSFLGIFFSILTFIIITSWFMY